MKDLIQRFREFISNENLFQEKDKLLLAVSGGLDSVVLCELCYRAGYDFVIAHCNFQLRGEESDLDEDFVNKIARKYGKTFFLKKFDTADYATEKKISIQVAARELRYAWFLDIAGGYRPGLPIPDFDLPAPNCIVTAHHFDDNIETVLMNFFKGTGITGLHGILPKKGKITRPLLFVKKEELKQFAVNNCLQWREDRSNESDKYTRNYFRHQIIPLIEKIYPGAINNLSSNIARFRDVEILYDDAVFRHKKKLLEQKGNEVHIPVNKLKKEAALRTIIYEIINDYAFSPQQVDEVIHLLNSESGKYIQSASHRIIKNRDWLIISSNNLPEADNVIIDGTGRWKLAEGSLQLETVPAAKHKLQTTNLVAQLDASQIKFPLIFRKWKRGDYFYPLGMKKKKKIARFLIDNKLSQTEKEKLQVIEMNKKIIWVAGMRIDERFKITQQTKNVLIIHFNK
ncbi:MAG TPA: tRNA lysidine(34) synthetase TilS [Puia sp.]|nr:tRNA lysidine(34) synthetase TilS [Puia sp.]